MKKHFRYCTLILYFSIFISGNVSFAKNSINEIDSVINPASGILLSRPINLNGRVIMDANSNCIIDPNEIGIVGTMVKIENPGNGSTIFTNVYDSLGNFAVSLDSGKNIITLLPPNPYWQLCNSVFLPDGVGSSYTSIIPVSCFNPGQTLTSANDIQNLCIDIEHSYSGDIKIELICPNGQTVELKSIPSGAGTYMGCPLGDPAVGPGTGRLYCFSPTAITPLSSATTSNCGSPASPSFDAGNYQPDQSFAGLIGCPLNGDWTLSVMDSFAVDNGYVFNWEINFTANPNCLSAYSSAGPRTISIDSLSTQINLEWVFQPTISCPFMTVDLNVPILRKTRPSFYHVNYCNTGNVDAINAAVQVTIDPLLNVLSTSVPFVSQTGNVYNFNVGNVPVGKCGSFAIEVIVDTTAFFGQTHCSYAQVLPDSFCIPNLWNGAILKTNANCNNDTVFFRIENNGAAMSNSRTYYILENDTIIVQDFVQLGSGSSLDVAQPALSGKTYRLIVKQETGYPELLGDSVSTVFVENCNVASGTNISRGYGLSFSNGDIAPARAVDCAQNVSAYDPNDKRGQPVGYGANNYIYDYTTLEYTIRFQNMGNDTAFNVVVLDTLDPFLDISSIVVGASSHNHIWQIIDGNVLRISFPDIKLTDTITNEPLSHGFIKYRIDQQNSNPVGTVIENRAGIYFDFEPVVLTNTTRHIIFEDFEATVVGTEHVLKENVSVQVFPNPFDNLTNFKVSGFDFPSLTLSVFDLSGKLIREIKGSGNQLQLSRDGLNQGLYFYKLSSEGDLIHSGKIIVR
jgi:subtilisin-like proprotein convertase family protein